LTAEADGSRTVLSHRERGYGDPLLLLNGVAMGAASWEPVAVHLEQRFRVIRCDFRGQLLTPASPPGELTGHADDVNGLLDHLGLAKVHLVGTSFGGVIGALLAARNPGRVRSLVTIASADGFDEEMADEVEKWREACRRSLEGPDRGVLSDVLEPAAYSPRYLADHREEREERRRQISGLPDAFFEGLLALLDTAHSFRMREELARISCPTLVIAAELDGFVPLQRARGFAEAIVGADFRFVNGAGHAVVVEQPDEVARLCLDFLEGVSRSY
jgi:pimeloyl-ACP methyl ester carboxylesterase